MGEESGVGVAGACFLRGGKRGKGGEKGGFGRGRERERKVGFVLVMMFMFSFSILSL